MFVEQPFISNWAKFGRKRIKPKNKNLRGQRWNLFTHNIIFIDKHDFRSSVSRQFHGHFLLFFGLPWILISFFDNSFSVRTVFVRFSLLLASRCARDWRRGKTKSETTPCYAARPYKFGNTEQGWSWKGLREQTNHRTSYQCKKTPPKCICLKRLPWKRKNNFAYTTKDWTFFHFMNNCWRWKC